MPKQRAIEKGPQFLIYGLVDPISLLIRYVGLSSSGLGRPRSHRHKAQNEKTHCRRWVRKLQASGLDYIIVVLEEIEDPIRLAAAECWWIAYGKASGWPLTNIAEGGGAYDPAEMRHRAARRARLKLEKAARAAAIVAAKEVAAADSRRHVDNMRRWLELKEVRETAEIESRNTANTETVRKCLSLFVQHTAEAVKKLPRLQEWGLVHYFVFGPDCLLQCACGYAESTAQAAVDDETLARNMAGLRRHIWEALRIEKLNEERIRKVNEEYSRTRIQNDTSRPRKRRS